MPIDASRPSIFILDSHRLYPPAIALAAQRLMTNQQLEHWALITGVLYLVGIWSLAHGMALRKGSHAKPRAAQLMAGAGVI